jgi:hypothetical protein
MGMAWLRLAVATGIAVAAKAQKGRTRGVASSKGKLLNKGEIYF